MSEDKKDVADKAKTDLATMEVAMFEADGGVGMQMEQ